MKNWRERLKTEAGGRKGSHKPAIQGRKPKTAGSCSVIKGIIRCYNTEKNILQGWHRLYSRCSRSRPWSFILFASCWAFRLSRQILDAYLFFSREDSEKSITVLEGELMIAVSRWSSSPIWSKRRGFASSSTADVSLWRPECFTDVRDRWSVTGSHKSESTCGSKEVAMNWLTAGWHFGPFDWTLYSQKYCFCPSEPPLLCLHHGDNDESTTVRSKNSMQTEPVFTTLNLSCNI